MPGRKKINTTEHPERGGQGDPGHIPHWIVRWGIFLLFITIAIILLGSWVFKYPYIITAKIYVTTENPPYHAVAKTDGRIATLL